MLPFHFTFWGGWVRSYFLVDWWEGFHVTAKVLHESDGIMVNEDRFVQEMSKPQHGGLTSSAAKIKFAEMLSDPTIIKDKKNGENRVRLDLEDHVRLQNKFSKLKQLLFSEAQKKMTDENKQLLMNRVLSDHNKSFAGQDVDTLAMAQQMALGAGRSASAFDADMMRLGNLQDLAGSGPGDGAGSASDKPTGGDDKAGLGIHNQS